VSYTFPADDQVPGNIGHTSDHNNIVDVLSGNSTIVNNVLNTAYAGGADPTGVSDSTAAIQAAITNLPSGGIVYFPAGTYKVSSTLTCTVAGVYFRGDGRWISIINYTGSGPCIRMYITAAYSPGSTAGGGLFDFIIDGTSASAGASGFHIGDIYNLEFNVGVRNFQGTGSKGAWLDNNYHWAEQMTGKIWVEQCTAGVVFDNSANTSGVSTGSYDRAILDIFLDQKGKGNCVVFQNGAFIINGRLGIYGNTDYGSTTYYVLTLTGSNGSGYSLLRNSILNIGVECNGTTGTQPGTINFASEANNIIWQCSGLIDFSGNNTFAHANNSIASMMFDGPVYGDTDLWSSGVLGLYPYKFGALSNGNSIPTKYQGITEVTTSGNVTGIILQGYATDDWRTVTVINNGSGTITFAASGSNVANGSSCVIAANSAQAFVWNNDITLWFPVS
jgi:pectate lyase-like protein